jgi:hypothetical protein
MKRRKESLAEKREALEAAGFKFGHAADFLEMNQTERLVSTLKYIKKLADYRLGTLEAYENLLQRISKNCEEEIKSIMDK